MNTYTQISTIATLLMILVLAATTPNITRADDGYGGGASYGYYDGGTSYGSYDSGSYYGGYGGYGGYDDTSTSPVRALT